MLRKKSCEYKHKALGRGTGPQRAAPGISPMGKDAGPSMA